MSKWENGTTIPNLEVLLKISKLYDMMLGSKAQLPNLENLIFYSKYRQSTLLFSEPYGTDLHLYIQTGCPSYKEAVRYGF